MSTSAVSRATVPPLSTARSHDSLKPVSGSGRWRAWAFWPVMVLAGAIYAAGVLPPRWQTWHALQQQAEAERSALDALRAEAQHEQRMAELVRSDPRFRQEYAWTVFGLPPDANEIPLPDQLAFDGRKGQASAPVIDAVDSHESATWAALAAWAVRWQSACLLTAGGLTLLAFGCLHAGPVEAPWRLMTEAVSRRYLRRR